MLSKKLTLIVKDGYAALEALDTTTGEYKEIVIRETAEELKALAKQVLVDDEGNPKLDDNGNPILCISPFTYTE